MSSLGPEVRALVRQAAPEAPVYREFTIEFLAKRSMVIGAALEIAAALASRRLLKKRPSTTSTR